MCYLVVLLAVIVFGGVGSCTILETAVHGSDVSALAIVVLSLLVHARDANKTAPSWLCNVKDIEECNQSSLSSDSFSV